MIITNYTPQYAKTVQFTSYKSVLGKKLTIAIEKGKADDSEKNFLIGQLQKFIALKTIPERNLGEGRNGKVFKIDDMFVIKTPIYSRPADETITLVTPKFSELKTYYGEPAAIYSEFKILHNVSSNGKHIEAGVPFNLAKRFTEEQRQKFYEKIYLPLFSEVPQKSFDAVAKDCDTLNKMGRGDKNYTFDFMNPNNFVLVGNSLRITDGIFDTSVKNPNNISNLLEAFLGKTDLDNSAVFSPDVLPYSQKIFRKIVLAGMKYNLPLGDECDDILRWENSAEILCRTNVTACEIIENLSRIQKEIPDTKTRLKKASEYLDEILNYKENFELDVF